MFHQHNSDESHQIETVAVTARREWAVFLRRNKTERGLFVRRRTGTFKQRLGRWRWYLRCSYSPTVRQRRRSPLSKVHLQNHYAQPGSSSAKPVKPLKQNVSFTPDEGRIENAITYPQALLHEETRNKITIAIEKTVLLEGRPQRNTNTTICVSHFSKVFTKKPPPLIYRRRTPFYKRWPERRWLIRLDLGGRRTKDQTRAERIAPFITEEGAWKRTYKHASSVGLMSLVAGRSQWESTHLFAVGRSS